MGFARCALAGLMMLAATGCKKAQDEALEAAVAVQAAHPTEGPIAEEISADAILAPLSQAAIAPRISAPIRAEYVQRGAHVRRGQLLVSLDDRRPARAMRAGEYRRGDKRHRPTTTATDADDDSGGGQGRPNSTPWRNQSGYETMWPCERQRERQKALFKQGALSGTRSRRGVCRCGAGGGALALARQHLSSVVKTTGATTQQSAQGQLDSARGRLISAQAQESYAQLRSPIDGVVTDRPLFPGETSVAGSTLITVMNTSSLLAKLHLSQTAAQKLEVGRRAEIRFAGVDEPVAATVSFISPALDPGSATVEVWLALPNAEGRFKVGTPVHALIYGIAVPRALLIPPAAVLPTQDGGTAVMVVGADGVAHTRAIKTGIRTTGAVQVLSGLSANDMVVTTGGYGLDDKTKVTIGKPAAGGETD